MSKLNSLWVISQVDTTEASDTTNYEQCMHEIAKFDNVEDFWQIFSHLKKPSELGEGVELELFREGYRPIWEDPVNKECGKWYIITTINQTCDILWEQSVLALIGEQFDENIVGIVIKKKEIGGIHSYWIKTSEMKKMNEVAANIDEKLKLPDGTKIFFKYHDGAKKSVKPYYAENDSSHRN